MNNQEMNLAIQKLIAEGWMEYRRSNPSVTVSLADYARAQVYHVTTFVKWCKEYEDELSRRDCEPASGEALLRGTEVIIERAISNALISELIDQDQARKNER